MTKIFLGLNSAYHESAACLLVDGRLAAAAEEERFNRVRHGKLAVVSAAGELPCGSIDACLRLGKVEMKDVTEIGYSFVPSARFEANSLPGVEQGDEGWGTVAGEAAFRDALLEIPARLGDLYGCDLGPRWVWVPHHLCHLAGAYFQSGYPDSALLCIDGIGESACTSIGEADGCDLRVVRSIGYPHSLGMLWEKLSRFLGFSAYDASKTMSLAAFGDARVFQSRFETLVAMNSQGYAFDGSLVRLRQQDLSDVARLLGAEPRLPGGPLVRLHFDIAAALQELTTRVVLHMAGLVKRQTGRSRLCLSGGVALNCQTNDALSRSGLFDRLFVPGAANDAGTAAGAAFLLAKWRDDDRLMLEPWESCLGTFYSEEDCEQAACQAGHRFVRLDDVEPVAARLLANGKIVGWFRGRMEFGPRALGARSILADPRRLDLRRRLDEEIKFRESFRPYAPSVVEARARDWFQLPAASDAAYFMLLACPVQPDRRTRIPSVIHEDGSCRVQLVSPAISPSFHRLLEDFEAITGIPILLNTSLNSRGPIVQSPGEAIRVFEDTTLDVLVLGNLVLCKEGQDLS
jgi:carbamoyltransferase